MWGSTGVVVAVALFVAACGEETFGRLAEPPSSDDDPRDAGADPDGAIAADPDAMPEAPIDASPTLDAGAEPEPTDLAELCGGHEPVTLADWEACYQRRKCEWEVGCVPLNPYRDVADCVASRDAVEHGAPAAARRARARAIAQGRAAIDVAAFTQCLFETSATHCNTALYNAACLTRFTGTIDDEDSCYADVDCASPDATCEATCSDACCLGTCQPKARTDEPCDDVGTCEPGLMCSTSGHCVTGDIGSACSEVFDCDWNAWCDPASHRCKPRFAPGASCTSVLQCAGDTSCVGTSITSSTPGQCLRNSRPGDRCDGLCHGNLYCDASGICRSLPVLDQACSPLIPCAGADTICAAGVCVRRSSVGVTCGNQSCLPALFCTSELGDTKPTCAAPRADGAVCGAADQCESNLCSGDPAHHGICLPWRNTCLD